MRKMNIFSFSRVNISSSPHSHRLVIHLKFLVKTFLWFSKKNKTADEIQSRGWTRSSENMMMEWKKNIFSWQDNSISLLKRKSWLNEDFKKTNSLENNVWIAWMASLHVITLKNVVKKTTKEEIVISMWMMNKNV